MTQALLQIFFILTVGVLIIGHAKVFPSNLKIAHHKHSSWDFLLFTQQWPAVSCITYQALSPKHVCNITQDIKNWTIHGIWPSKYHKDSPSFCNQSFTFDVSELKAIKPQLDIQWANIFANTPEDQLWAHEWNKHGTCAASLPSLDTEIKFFKQGLAWSLQYNLFEILEEFGITPNDKEPVLASDIKQAIIKKLNVVPLLVCSYEPKNKTYYIFEIELCFNKDLQLITCQDRVLIDSPAQIGSVPCPDKQLVYYPTIKYNSKRLKQNSASESPYVNLSDGNEWFRKLYYTVMTINRYLP